MKFFYQSINNFTKTVNKAHGVKFNATVIDTKEQSDGKILVGGSFINYGGTTGRSYLIRLNSDYTLDTAFCANAVDGAKFNNIVFSIAVQSDGKILVGSAFTNYGGVSGRNKLIRLNSDGTVDTAFCINAADGGKLNNSVYSIILESDGKILVGGNFTNYDGVTGRSYLIRLNSDGTLDTSFCANAVDGGKFNNLVYSMAYQPDGKILVGGSFTNYGGTVNRNRLLRLNSDGTVDTAFCINAADGNKFSTGSIGATNGGKGICVQSDGKILVGGQFAFYGGVAGRDNLLRLNSDGTLDTAFCVNAVDGPKFVSSVFLVFQLPDGKIIVSSFVSSIGGVSGRGYLIRLNSDGTVDTAFCANAVDGSKFNNGSTAVFVKSDGKITIGGSFTNYGNFFNKSYFLVLNDNGTEYSIEANRSPATINGGSIVLKSNGDIVAALNGLNLQGVSGRNYLLCYNPDGSIKDSFTDAAASSGKFNSNIWSLGCQPDDKILVGGNFSNYASTSNRSRLIRLNSDGTLDTAFCANAVDGAKFNGAVQRVWYLPDNKIIVSGTFTNYGGTTGRSYLVRLNSDGTLDTAFCVNAVDSSKFNSYATCCYYQSDGKILLGGFFTNYGGTTGRSYLVRLNSDGTLDTAFCANAVDGSKFNNASRGIVIQSSGKILVGGSFTNYGGTNGRNYLIRLNSDGTLDTSFCNSIVDGAKFNNSINYIANMANDSFMLMGAFNIYGGANGPSNVARFFSDYTYEHVKDFNGAGDTGVTVASTYSVTTTGSNCIAVYPEGNTALIISSNGNANGLQFGSIVKIKNGKIV